MTDSAPNANALLDALTPGVCLTVDKLAETTGLPKKEVSRAAGQLVLRELAERTARGCYQLTAAGAAFKAGGERIASGPRRGVPRTGRRRTADTLRDRLWAALRIRGKASIPELLELALADGERAETSYDNAKSFLRLLRRAGYLIELRRERGAAPSSNGFKRYGLVRDSGPETPQVRRPKPAHGDRPAIGAHVYDPNTGACHPLSTPAATEDQP